MAYEAEKQRILTLIQNQTGIARTWNADLAREADERAYEGYQEVGTGPQADGSHKGITHPTQMERESRLGPEWAGKGVAEIAVWEYGWSDPVAHAVESWMASTAHRNVLIDPRFKHIGIGIYTIVPAGTTIRRWYFIAWLSISVPTAVTPEVDMILLPIELYPAGTKAYFTAGVSYSFYKVVSGTLQRKNWVPSSTTNATVGARTSLNGDTAKAGFYIMDGIHAGWVLSGWTPPASVVKPSVPVDQSALVLELQSRITRKNAKADELKAI